MADFVISGSSTADLTAEHFEKRDIKYICYKYLLDGKEYIDDFGKSLSFKDFYQALRDGVEAKTWQINSSTICDYFRPFLQDGKDVIHLTLSSGLTGGYNSVVLAAEQLKEEFPERTVYVLDSLGASSGYGMILEKMADLRDEGKTPQEICDWVNEHRLNMHYEFFSTDLTFYIKGGRISKASGMVGTLLGICPLMDMNSEGKLIPRQKIRTKKKVIKKIVERMEDQADDGLEYSGKCYICHSDCYDDALYLKSLIEEKFKNIDGEIEIFDIGTVIGSHSGPGTAAAFFWGKTRTL